jgi:amidase
LQNPAATPEESTGLPRRHVLKAGVVAAGVGLLGRFAHASSSDAVSPADYQSMDAWDMANAVRKGELSPEHLLAAAMARCDAVNPKVNAVNMRHDEYATALLKSRRTAGTSNVGALAGVPILIKDLNTPLEGTRTTHGCRLYKDAPPAPQTSTLIARYQAQGAVPFGKTTCPEFGLTTTTESLLWGQTRNPWNLAHSAGGSSGGAAAAVAAGIVPVAHATDGGGSIRIPASYCGLENMRAGLGPAWATWSHAISATWLCFSMLGRAMSPAAHTGQNPWCALTWMRFKPHPARCALVWCVNR